MAADDGHIVSGGRMTDIVVLPMNRAVLCVDCMNLTNAVGSYCPACASPSLIALSRVLDREPEPKTETVMADA